MILDEFVDYLKQVMPEGLHAVVLYGSAAAGDHVSGKSDYNVLIVTERLGVAELNALAEPVGAWVDAGQRPPRLFTRAQLAGSADAFPIEMLDLKDAHKMLHGEDPLVGITVNPENLRLQVERELKGKLLYLRERYVLSRGEPDRVAKLMADSLSNFLVLFRAALRLYQDSVPPQKLDAARALAQHVVFDAQVLTEISELREGKQKCADEVALAKFEQYLKIVEQVVDAVDHRVQPQS